MSPITNRDPNLANKGRICLNAQSEYSKAKYKVTVKPAGTTADVDSTGSTSVTFSGISGSDPNALQDGEEFWVEETGDTGTYEIEIQHQDCSDCTAKYNETVFKFILDANEPSSQPGDPGINEYEKYAAEISDWGDTVNIQYDRLVGVITEPKLSGGWSYDVRAHFKHQAKFGLSTTFYGRSNGTPWWADVISDTPWDNFLEAIKTATGNWGSVITDAMSHAMNDVTGHWKYSACGIAKPAFDVEGTTFGDPTNKPFPAASTNVSWNVLHDVNTPPVFDSTQPLPDPGPVDTGAEVQSCEIIGARTFQHNNDLTFNFKVGASFDTDNVYNWIPETVWPELTYVAAGVAMTNSNPRGSYSYPGWEDSYEEPRFKVTFWTVTSPTVSEVSSDHVFEIK